MVVVFSEARIVLNLPLHVGSVVGAIESLLRIIAYTWAALRLLDVFTGRLMERLLARQQVSSLGLVPPGRRIAQIVIVAIGMIVALGAVGFNVTAVVAGLGVGGIAVALAAQKSIEQLFGGATLYADQPVKVGDFCRFGDKTGTIEEIGLRSTRVRTLDRTMLTIPNAEFSNLQLENFSKRDKFRFFPRISLRYETTPDQMRFVLIEIRELLYRHPKIDLDPCRVRFTTFSACSLDIDIFAYVLTRDMNEFLAVAEDLNLRIMDVVARSGAGFAFPSQTVYLEPGSPPDAELRTRAEETVRGWRESDALYISKFPDEKIAEIVNTLDYPPKGTPPER
jgi:MscS family membrane protein